jgi:uncharacterized membrane protein YqiK
MSHPLFLLAAVLVLGLAGCKKTKTSAEANAERAKAWQSQQMARAAKSYQELVTAYPDSPYAEQARERVRAIGPVATPPPKKK